MQENRRIQLLVIASILTLATLISIQVYLIHNTYRLHKHSFNQEIKEKINSIMKLPGLDTLEDLMQENLKNTVTEYVHGRLGKDGVFRQLQAQNAILATTYNQRLGRLLKQNFHIDDARYSSVYDAVIIDFEGHTDTLLNAPNRPFAVVGLAEQPEDAVLLNRNTWVVNRVIDDEQIPAGEIEMRIMVRQSNYYLISDWQLAIYREMAGVLILAVGLIAAIIGLFYIVFHAMVKQKKLAAMKTDFANNITHELKTPLSSVSVILKSMKKINLRTEPVLMQQLIGSMDRQFLKIQQLVNHVLESAISHTTLELENVVMPSFLNEYVLDLKIPDHELRTEFDPSVIQLQSNGVALMRILNILVDNAAKYSPADMPILIKSFTDRSLYYIQVVDQGAGIDKQNHQLIFDKFYRIPEHNRHNVKGLGLGLYIAKETALQIKASITVTNAIPSGSKFTICLPL